MKFNFNFFIILFVSFSSSAHALLISSEHARIDQRLEGKPGKTIVLIQEAHVQYEAQKALAAILQDLIEHESLRLIFVEGGWGDINLDYLRGYGSKKGREEVAETYLREGKISGEEYLQLSTDLSMQLWGIENENLYASNMQAYLKISERRQEIEAKWAKINKEIQKSAGKIFSRELNQLLAQSQQFENGELALPAYLAYLNSIISKQQSNIRPQATLQRLFALSGLDAEIDLPKVEWQKKELIKKLSKKLTKPEFEEIQALAQDQNLELETKYIKSLLTACERFSTQIKCTNYSQLQEYAATLTAFHAVNAKLVYQEISQLTHQLALSLIQNAEQKRSYEIYRLTQLLDKLFRLKLSPEEFEILSSSSLSIPLLCAKLQAVDSCLSASEIKLYLSFYQSAQQREEAMISNLLQKSYTVQDSVMAMIIGGFHTEALAARLHSQGFNVIQVSPRFEMRGNWEKQQQHYFDILKYKWDSRQDSLPKFPNSQTKGDLPHEFSTKL